MGRIVIELTDRCNLRCGHCIDARHGGRGELSLAVIERLLAEAKGLGFAELAFTGGEPTLHRQFFDILGRAAAGGYRFGFVTNGWAFPRLYARLLAHRTALTAITFSLDGASEATHDALRGRGSYRRVLQAMSVCVATGLPFTLNMVVTRHNRGELADLVALGAALGARGVRFGPLMPGGDPALELSAAERRDAQAAIEALQGQANIPVALAPGYETTELRPCAPLHLEELNIDWRGNVTPCCHLSGYGEADRAGNLATVSLAAALGRLREANAHFLQEKEAHRAEADPAPCRFCLKYLHPAAAPVADLQPMALPGGGRC